MDFMDSWGFRRGARTPAEQLEELELANYLRANVKELGVGSYIAVQYSGSGDYTLDRGGSVELKTISGAGVRAMTNNLRNLLEKRQIGDDHGLPVFKSVVIEFKNGLSPAAARAKLESYLRERIRDPHKPYAAGLATFEVYIVTRNAQGERHLTKISRLEIKRIVEDERRKCHRLAKPVVDPTVREALGRLATSLDAAARRRMMRHPPSLVKRPEPVKPPPPPPPVPPPDLPPLFHRWR